MTNYDVAIVGAGPTGLMAAKRGAEKGLRVVVIERKKDVSIIRRACCSHFVMDVGYAGEALQVTNGKIVFPRNGFEVCYEGPTRTITDKYFNSPDRHTIHFSHQNGQPIGIKFDKGRLLQGLKEECERLNVECMTGTVAYKAQDTPDKVTVHTVSGGTKSFVTARKGIVADGANAHIPESLGMNKERKYYHTALAEKYIVDGVNDYKPLSWNFFFGRAFRSHAPVIIGPSLYGNDVVEVTIMGSRNKLPAAIFEKVATDSPLTHMFNDSQLIDKHACSLRTFNALPVPYKGNVLVAGDSAAYIEVEVQGGLMCGYHAANAVASELNGENGFEQYTTWWQKSFEFNSDDYLKVAQGYALVPTYSDDELDYLFSLIEDEVLEGTFSQYKTPKVMWSAMLMHKERIAREKPNLYKKVCTIDTMSLSTTF
jgi:flavin-dependent dehydrogenase